MALTVYSWPHLWNLPSFDADCLAVIFYLQLAFPANYSIVECTDPDISPSGTLPLLVHNSTKVSGVSSIFAYLSSLDRKSDEWGHGTTVIPNLDEALSNEQKAKSVAWKAYVNNHIFNLVVRSPLFLDKKTKTTQSHSLFVLEHNFTQVVHRELVPLFPIPQRYYVPGRLRTALQPRLESAGLWVIANDSGTSDSPEQPFQPLDAQLRAKASQTQATREKLVSTAFAREKVIERARASFDLLTPLIIVSPTPFFFASTGERPSTLDITLAAQLLLFMRAPLPSNPVYELLKATYPALLEHAEAVMTAAFPLDGAEPMVEVMRSTGVGRALARTVGRIVGSFTDEDTRVTNGSTLRERIAYTWVGLAGLGTVAYLLGTILIHGITVEEEESSNPPDLSVTHDIEDALATEGTNHIAVTEATVAA